ncbi:MAG TPA: alpha/beta hydrolase [Candidatus Saccharimonadales bacterium]|nr:alpha/beta hydrolase [Candidatus Saccharimonadales bacterium]
MPKRNLDAADYIQPLNINGLEGRMLYLPTQNKKYDRDILFVYGQHSSLERWWGLIKVFSHYGNVTMPDMPGFGGMASLYKIGHTATIDELADYLAAFMKLKYKRRKVTIVAMSLGFATATRMLQKYPELTDRVEMLVSVVGFSHHDDFIFPKSRMRMYKLVCGLFSRRLPAAFFQGVFLQPFYLRRAYKHSRFAKEKLAKMSGDEFNKTMDMEIVLWRINDIRTQMKTNVEMFNLNNCGKHINLPVYHVASQHDRYFNHVKVEEHFRQIFTDVNVFFTKDPNHAPTIIADEKTAAPFVPDGLRKAFAKNPTAKKSQQSSKRSSKRTVKK